MKIYYFMLCMKNHKMCPWSPSFVNEKVKYTSPSFVNEKKVKYTVLLSLTWCIWFLMEIALVRKECMKCGAVTTYVQVKISLWKIDIVFQQGCKLFVKRWSLRIGRWVCVMITKNKPNMALLWIECLEIYLLADYIILLKSFGLWGTITL